MRQSDPRGRSVDSETCLQGRSVDYGRDVLAQPRRKREVPRLPAEAGLVVEDAAGGFCGAVLRCERDVVVLEDAKGCTRNFPL
ncbi:MAG TPA: DUF3097 family protein, partial [Pseudonocardiaceae bacterium]|nr:DUF3097 family protein [Pseudonocardiaceae bacterium]